MLVNLVTDPVKGRCGDAQQYEQKPVFLNGQGSKCSVKKNAQTGIGDKMKDLIRKLEGRHPFRGGQIGLNVNHQAIYDQWKPIV